MSKMGEGTKLAKATKTKIGVAVGAVAVSAAVLAVVLLSGEESFRTVAVEEVNGTSLVASNGNEAVNAYEGMHLYSGDDVSVQQDSDMTMVLDMDKYVYAEPGTHFWLECDGTTDDSRTVIYLDEGSILNRLKENLNEGEVYQVDTPNSTMAVRGTVFRVTVYRGEDGLVYTLLEVFEGQVQVDLKTEDGEYNGVSETFGPGEAALIRGNSDFSEFVLGEEDGENAGSVKLKIAYKEIPQSTAKVLVEYIDEGEELCIEKELLMDYTQLAEHRMETREGKKSTCIEAGYEEVWCVVCNEVTETVKLPLLEHKPGAWEVTLEPNCEEAGKQQRVCSECGTICEEQAIEALGHVEGELQTISTASCVSAGQQVAYCERCEKEIRRIVTDAIGHTAGGESTITHPSCTQEGVSQTKCSVCGLVLGEKRVNPTGHSWGNWTTASSGNCTTGGTQERKCSVCGNTETQTTGGTTGHSMSGWKTVSAASCKEEGIEKNICSVCGYTETRVTAKTGHSMGDWRETPATCTDNGIREKSCSVCGETETESIEATGHAWMGREHRNESEICTEEGEIQDYCSECSPNTLIFKEIIPANDHENIEWMPQDVAQEAVACKIGGIITGYCIDCGESVEREISAGEHVYGGAHGDLIPNEDGMRITCVCILCYEESVEAGVEGDICVNCNFPAAN